jgi:hypothetical protein
MASINERRLAVVQRVTREWEQRHALTTKPDPAYANAPDYAEGMVVMSADADAQTELHHAIQAAWAAEGLPITV